MPDKIIIEEKILKDIAQSIREGTSTDEKLVLSKFPYYIKEMGKEIKQLQEQVAAQPQIKTCTVELASDLEVYLHGYSATTYSNNKFYCNYITPQKKECYNKITIENVVCGSILVLNVSSKKLPIYFKGAECLESSQDFYTYLFKVEDDMTINISNKKL